MLAPAPSAVIDSPLADEEDDDDQSVTSTALGIESSATSFTGGITALRHVSWSKQMRRWKAQYKDANGKSRFLGRFDTQEQAAHAVNAAIRCAGLEGRRKTNPVVDGQLVPRALKAKGHGAEYLSGRRRGRRAVNYVDPEPDDDDEDLELGPPDDGDGWD